MNKKELAKALANKLNLSLNKTSDVINHTLELISKALSKNETIQLVGFGSFNVKKRKSRDGRNPATGEKIKIAACKAVRFSPGKALKDLVNKR